MAEFTEKYNLEKPAQNEFYDVDVQNRNMDTIDAELAKAGKNPQLEADVAEIKTEVGTTADTGGSETGGTIFAKLNKIINSVLKIGNTDDAQSDSVTTGSVFAKLNFLVFQNKVNFPNIYAWTSSIPNINAKLGSATDTGATETTGTVMGKLNALQTTLGKVEEVLDLI